MMKLKDSQQLEFYENHFHKKGYDTSNCPEYLKKHLNTLSWVYSGNLTCTKKSEFLLNLTN